MRSQAHKAEAFRALHEGEPFVLPNPWDSGSARMLAALGFPALATTSAGFAYTLGRRDGRVTLDEVVAHVRTLTEVADLPLSVDLEKGFSDAPNDVAAAVRRVAEAGAVGASIEDYDGSSRIYPLEQAAERVAAAAAAAHELPFPFTLTARAENHIRGKPELDDTIARLRAFERAGARVLYAPGLRTAEEMRAVCAAVSAPVNVLAVQNLTFAEIASAGAQRISLGGSLTWVAVDAFVAAARAIRELGDFSVLNASPAPAEWLG